MMQLHALLTPPQFSPRLNSTVPFGLLHGRYVLLATLLAVAVVQASADTVVVGAPAPSYNSFPFNDFDFFSGTRYQQVYSSSAFPGTLTITGLDFYNTASRSNAEISAGTYQTYLSTTSAPVNGLNTSNLDANVGPDNTLVANWVLSSPLSVLSGSSFTIPFSTPFTYNPSNGNLLLDIFTSGLSGGSGELDAWNNPSAPFSRAMQCMGCSGTSGFGLVTGFNSAVPEPGTLPLTVAGMILAGAQFLRRRR